MQIISGDTPPGAREGGGGFDLFVVWGQVHFPFMHSRSLPLCLPRSRSRSRSRLALFVLPGRSFGFGVLCAEVAGAGRAAGVGSGVVGQFAFGD